MRYVICRRSLPDNETIDFGNGWYGAKIGCLIQRYRRHEDQHYFVWHKCPDGLYQQHGLSGGDAPMHCGFCKTECPQGIVAAIGAYMFGWFY